MSSFVGWVAGFVSNRKDYFFWISAGRLMLLRKDIQTLFKRFLMFFFQRVRRWQLELSNLTSVQLDKCTFSNDKLKQEQNNIQLQMSSTTGSQERTKRNSLCKPTNCLKMSLLGSKTHWRTAVFVPYNHKYHSQRNQSCWNTKPLAWGI